MAASWAEEASSFSSSSSMQPKWKYDAFLSFRGEDTRYNFTSHLFAGLQRHGIHTFKDDKRLEKGEDVPSELLNAIEESRISVIVFSENYGDSKWCLNELVKIMQCNKTLKQNVLPIFYHVDPSDVREQKGSFAKAIAKHEEHFKEHLEGKVEKWRAALTGAAKLSGWHLPSEANREEAKVIEEIIEVVGKKLDVAYLNVHNHPVGLDRRVQELKTLLNIESNDVRIVGVWGVGGIGKTTIAKELYNLIHHKFEGSSFLANVKESSMQPNGLVVLQKKLLSGIVRNDTHCIIDIDHGIGVLKRRAFYQKVLLVLDDVDNVQQLEALAIDRHFFRPGSRIIITTRDKSSLRSLQLQEFEEYKPGELDEVESLQLFSWHAFNEDHPMNDYVELSHQVVNYAGGLPLALEVLGRFLCRLNIFEWEDEMERLRKIPHGQIQETLKTTYDSLSGEEKELFLDIACFFVGMGRDFIIKILKSCNFYPIIGLRVLFERCLIKYEGYDNQIVMHDLLRDMGREIVRQESIKEPGSRTRIWYHEDAIKVLRDGTGTNLVEGLFLDLPEPKDIKVNENAFKRMSQLRLLHLNYVRLSAGYEHFSRSLVWLCWKGFPMKCLPSNWLMENLVALDLSYSSVRQVWNRTMVLGKLKFLYLSHCRNLTETPDFSGLKNLEELFLNDCIRLVDVHESIKCLSKLLVLDITNCRNLRKLPSGIWMLNIQCLDLSGCSKLGMISGFRGSISKLVNSLLSSFMLTFFLVMIFLSWTTKSPLMLRLSIPIISWTSRTKNVDSIGLSLVPVQSLSCLKRLNMPCCNLSHLPNGIGCLVSLEELNLEGNNLRTIPASIGNLTRLETLCMQDCKVSHLPDEIGRLISLKVLFLSENKLSALPESIGNLVCMENLYASNCNLSHLPSEIGRLINLKALFLSENRLSALPESIGNLVCIEDLDVSNCNLSHLPSEIGRLINLKALFLSENKLSALPESIGNLVCVEDLDVSNCNLSHLPSEIGRLINLKALFLSENKFSALPESIGNLVCLEKLYVNNCNLSHLPSEIGRLMSLKSLGLSGNNLGTLPNSIGNLTRLGVLLINDCNVSHLPSEIGSLISLHSFMLKGNNGCTLPDSIGNLTCLSYLKMEDCKVSHLPDGIWNLISLRSLVLSENNFCNLSDSISNLTQLQVLKLNKCPRLQSLPKLPFSLHQLYVNNCASLEDTLIIQSNRLRYPIMAFAGCQNLINFADNFRSRRLVSKGLSEFKYSIDMVVPALSGVLPSWLDYQNTEGSNLSFEMPSPPLVNQQILGLIFCSVSIGAGYPYRIWYFIFNKTKGSEYRHFSWIATLDLTHEVDVWFSYVPLCEFKETQLEGGNVVEISAKFSEVGPTMKRFGVSFIYKDEYENTIKEDKFMINHPHQEKEKEREKNDESCRSDKKQKNTNDQYTLVS